MMPCSWLLVFLGSVIVFVVICLNWSYFFFFSFSILDNKQSLIKSKNFSFWV